MNHLSAPLLYFDLLTFFNLIKLSLMCYLTSGSDWIEYVEELCLVWSIARSLLSIPRGTFSHLSLTRLVLANTFNASFSFRAIAMLSQVLRMVFNTALLSNNFPVRSHFELLPFLLLEMWRSEVLMKGSFSHIF